MCYMTGQFMCCLHLSHQAFDRRGRTHYFYDKAIVKDLGVLRQIKNNEKAQAVYWGNDHDWETARGAGLAHIGCRAL